MKKLATYILVMVLLATSIAAIGVSPARTTIDYTADSSRDVIITIINTEGRNIAATVYTEDKSGIVKIEDNEFDLSHNEKSKDIKLKLKLPPNMKPGITDIDIVIKQLPDEEYPSPLFIKTELAVISQIRIRAPYPGKYAEIENIEVTNAIVNSTARFSVPVINFGNATINELQAKIKILDPDKNVKAEILSQKTTLDANRRVILEAQWNTGNMPTGKYHAIAEVMFDGMTNTKEKDFNLGKLIIRLLRVETNNYQFGGIAKYDIWVQSEWNEKIKDMFGELEINDSNQQIIATLKTPTTELEPYTPTAITAFWDTSSVPIGQYFLHLRLRFNGIVQEADMISDLTYDGIRTRLVDISGKAVAKTFKASTLIPIIIVILLIANIIYMVRRRNQNPPPQ